MKKLIFVILCLIGASAQASLKLQAQLNGYNENKDPRPQIGLALYQKLIKGSALNAWAGTGLDITESGGEIQWYSAKAAFEVTVKKATVGIGYQVKDLDEEAEMRKYAFLRVEYKIF